MVDSGVVLNRRSIGVKTTIGQYIITPNNRTLTHIKGICSKVEVYIRNNTREVYRNIMVYEKSFADVYVGETLVYVN